MGMATAFQHWLFGAGEAIGVSSRAGWLEAGVDGRTAVSSVSSVLLAVNRRTKPGFVLFISYDFNMICSCPFKNGSVRAITICWGRGADQGPIPPPITGSKRI